MAKIASKIKEKKNICLRFYYIIWIIINECNSHAIDRLYCALKNNIRWSQVKVFFQKILPISLPSKTHLVSCPAFSYFFLMMNTSDSNVKNIGRLTFLKLLPIIIEKVEESIWHTAKIHMLFKLQIRPFLRRRQQRLYWRKYGR